MFGGQTLAQPHGQIQRLVVVHRFTCSLHAQQYATTDREHLLFSDKLLGGIGCADLLIQHQSVRQQVQLLVTVGTQLPFFYEIGALHSLSPDQPLPPDFPSWLNIYDLNDFLSYVGATVFPNQVQHVLVDNRQPLPQAHGAYSKNPASRTALITRLPCQTVLQSQHT